MTEYNLIDRLKFHEGDPVTKKAVIVPYKLEYTDANGKLVKEKHETVGYGHRVVPGEIVPTFRDDEEAENYFLGIFEKDVVTAKQQAKTLLKEPNKHPPRVLDLLTEMVFQLGIGSVRGFDTTLADINKGNYDLAAGEMLLGKKPNTRSPWHIQTPARAESVSKIMKQQYVVEKLSFLKTKETHEIIKQTALHGDPFQSRQIIREIT